MKLNHLFSEATREEMSEAMRWISLLKPYFIDAYKRECKLNYEFATAKKSDLGKKMAMASLVNLSPVRKRIIIDEFINSIKRAALSVEVPEEVIDSKPQEFHVDDEFDKYRYVSPFFRIDGPDIFKVSSNLSPQSVMPKIAVDYFIKMRNDHLQALRDNVVAFYQASNPT